MSVDPASGQPFAIGRDEVVANTAHGWCSSRPSKRRRTNRTARIWCAPEGCHADVLIELGNREFPEPTKFERGCARSGTRFVSELPAPGQHSYSIDNASTAFARLLGLPAWFQLQGQVTRPAAARSAMASRRAAIAKP